jgi:hypothetical protein
MLMKEFQILISGCQTKILWGVSLLHGFARSGQHLIRHLKALIDVVPVFLLVSGS